MSEATNGNLGAMECLVAASICGVIYHLFAGQPLIIVGATGIAKQSTVRYRRVRQGEEWQGMAWHGKASQAWQGTATVMARYDKGINEKKDKGMN